VDGICLLAVGKFPNTVAGLIQWALHTIKTWCDEVRLLVNPDKTGLVVFTRRTKLPGFFEPHLFDVTIYYPMSVKYLRVVLDSWLTWREHVDVKSKESSQFVVGMQDIWCDMGPESQGDSLALRLYHQAIHYFCILSSVAWLLDS